MSRFSIKDELKSRWATSHIPNIRVTGWTRILLDMGRFVGWEKKLFWKPDSMNHSERRKATMNPKLVNKYKIQLY
jgi:hypothetical protein